jgi:hypothetical protein
VNTTVSVPVDFTDLTMPAKLLAAGDLLLGDRIWPKVHATSAAVTGWPLLNFASCRSVMVHSSLFADGVQPEASCGSSLPLVLSMIRSRYGVETTAR